MTLSEQLKSLVGKATPGPWATEYDMFDSGDHATAISIPRYAGQMGAFIAHCAHNWHEAVRGERRISWKEAETNASLIVTLVNNLPTILAVLEAVENTRAEAISAEPAADITGYERGQRETVAQIVAWLRKCQKAKLNHHAEVCHREDDDVLDAIVTAMNTFAYAADAIEAGEWK